MATTHVTILSASGLGHLIPILELAKRIVTYDGFDVSLFVPHTDAPPALLELLRSTPLPKGLEIVGIPSVDISRFVDDEHTDIETRLSIIVKESLPLLESAIIKKSRPTILVVDFFATTAFDIFADGLCIKKYLFFTSTATALAFMMYLPILDQQVDGEFVHLLEPVRVPGCNPIQIDDLVEPVRNRNVEGYKWFLYHASRFWMASGILVNTCENLEPTSLKALREDPILCQIPTPRVYPVGPIVKPANPLTQSENEYCIKWLDMQPNDSVVFVSFGSAGTLSAEQMTELAWGLDLSQQRFIWVVKKPIDTSTNFGSFFRAGEKHDNPALCEFLPDGFMTRIQAHGLVVPSWAPQVDILAHGSTGGFISHCGWNSTLESMVHGVPIIAWPLFAEQKMNARLLVEELGVAVRPKEEGGMVGREEIARVVRLVMEDDTLRGRMKEIKNGVLRAMDKGGSSYNFLSQVLEEWRTTCMVVYAKHDIEDGGNG